MHADQQAAGAALIATGEALDEVRQLAPAAQIQIADAERTGISLR
jgi:hypothetical protein